MSRLRRFKPTGSLLVALAALVFATTGSAVGASLITSQKIKDGTIQTKDISKKARTRLKGKPGPRGLQGPKGDAGENGRQGPPGPFPDPLDSGKTLRGFWGHAWTPTAGGQVDNNFYSYGGFTLASAPTPHYISSGGVPPAGCTGGTFEDPKADPGHLCVYELDRINTSQPSVCGINFCPGSDDNGFQIALSSAAAGVAVARGSWAVTAP